MKANCCWIGLGVFALSSLVFAAKPIDPPVDPLENYYGNTLISERLINISGGGGAAHVWLWPYGAFVTFDVSTGGRFGTYQLKGAVGAYQLCMNYPAPMGTLCYPIEPHKVGETWISSDPGTLGKNSLVKGRQ